MRLGPSRILLLAALCLTALAAAVGFTSGTFRGATENPGNEISAAADFVAPEISLAELGGAAGGLLGAVTAGGSYHVYAKVTDSGNPASGVASVTADVAALTGAKNAVPLEAGSFTVDGNSYNYRSAELSVDADLAGGSYTLSITTKDAADNTRTRDIAVILDTTSATAAADVQTANGGSTVRRPERGDTITFAYRERVDAYSVLL